jgi:hypothetical protein
MTLNLEVGKSYITHAGEVFLVELKDIKTDELLPFHCSDGFFRNSAGIAIPGEDDINAAEEYITAIAYPVSPSAQARVAEDTLEELQKATSAFSPFHSAHEGYAVMKEEVDELWDEVKKKQSKHDKAAMRKEALQVAAMAMRFVIDICDKK